MRPGADAIKDALRRNSELRTAALLAAKLVVPCMPVPGPAQRAIQCCILPPKVAAEVAPAVLAEDQAVLAEAADAMLRCFD